LAGLGYADHGVCTSRFQPSSYESDAFWGVENPFFGARGVSSGFEELWNLLTRG
jgi:hypothetical protein